MKILIIISLILTSYLEEANINILYARIQSFKFMESLKLYIRFVNQKTGENFLWEVVKYEFQLRCNLCKQEGIVLCGIKNKKEIIYSCNDCIYTTENLDTFYIKLNANSFNSMGSIYVTGKITELYKLNNLIIKLTVEDEPINLYSSGKLVKLNNIEKIKLFNIKFLKVVSNKNNGKSKDRNKDYKCAYIREICYRFKNECLYKRKKRGYHYLTIEGFKIKKDSDIFRTLCLISKNIFKTIKRLNSNNKSLVYKKDSENLVLRFNIFYEVSNEKMLKDMIDQILKIYLLIYTNEKLIEFPLFDPFFGFKEYESLVTSEDVYNSFMPWLMHIGKLYSIVYSCDKELGSTGFFESIKSNLYGTEILKEIKKGCKKIELYNYFLLLQHYKLVFVMHFEKIISYENQKVILLFLSKYFKDKIVDYSFSIINNSQMYGVFKTSKFWYSAIYRNNFYKYLKTNFDIFGLTKVRLDYKKHEYDYKRNNNLNFKTHSEFIIKKDNVYEVNKLKENGLENGNLTEDVEQTSIGECDRGKKNNLPKSLTNQLYLYTECNNSQSNQQCNFDDIEQNSLNDEDSSTLIKIEKESYGCEKYLNTQQPIKTERDLYAYGEDLNTLIPDNQTMCSSSSAKHFMLENPYSINLIKKEPEISMGNDTNLVTNFNILKKRKIIDIKD